MATAEFIRFDSVKKSYDGENYVVRGLDLSVAQGEFLTLLGPSGSGKTTSLMMLAGFESPTAGEIHLDARRIDHVPAHQRNIGVVFQNYALFPHMSVADNVAFPLRMRGLNSTEITKQVRRALDMVRLVGMDARKPAQLSGGQQQRVALARAMVFEPKLVLMDEPLGALDKQLREHMQLEIKALHRRLGINVVYVTHDQSDNVSGAAAGAAVEACIRPERVVLHRIATAQQGANMLAAEVARVIYFGDHLRLLCSMGDGQAEATVKLPLDSLDGAAAPQAGEGVVLEFPMAHARIYAP